MENKEFNSKFNQLYTEYYEMLFKSAYKVVRDSDNAREVVQTVFVEVWENRKQWENIKSFKAYLLTSVFHRSLNSISKTKKIVSISDHHHPKENVVEKHVDGLELATQVAKAINQLPLKCKEIFLLSREEGLSYLQIAEQLDLSVKTVETQMGIAFKKLRQSLAMYNTSSQRKYFIFF